MERMQKMLSNVLHAGITERGFATVCAAIGTAITGWLGGYDMAVKALIVFMAVDFVLGILAAAKACEVDSQVMFWGGVNKILVLSLVGVAVVLDKLIGLGEPYIRTAVIWFYIGREGLSIIENYGNMGLPLPGIIKKVLHQIVEQSEKTEVKQEGNTDD